MVPLLWQREPAQQSESTLQAVPWEKQETHLSVAGEHFALQQSLPVAHAVALPSGMHDWQALLPPELNMHSGQALAQSAELVQVPLQLQAWTHRLPSHFPLQHWLLEEQAIPLLIAMQQPPEEVARSVTLQTKPVEQQSEPAIEQEAPAPSVQPAA